MRITIRKQITLTKTIPREIYMYIPPNWQYIKFEQTVLEFIRTW